MSNEIVVTEAGEIVLIIDQSSEDLIVVKESGPQGPPGPPGPGITPYEHHQTSAAASWTVNHNQGRYIEPLVFLEGEDTPVEADLVYPDVDTTVIIFPSPAAGWAYF